jgi:hypothetical protein
VHARLKDWEDHSTNWLGSSSLHKKSFISRIPQIRLPFVLVDQELPERQTKSKISSSRNSQGCWSSFGTERVASTTWTISTSERIRYRILIPELTVDDSKFLESGSPNFFLQYRDTQGELHAWPIHIVKLLESGYDLNACEECEVRY